MTRCKFPDCWHEAEKWDFCRKHVGSAPEEDQAVRTLIAQLQTAKDALDECAELILRSYVFPENAEPIPEDLRREYRALWYRFNYIRSVQNTRRPGDPLPAEVTKR